MYCLGIKLFADQLDFNTAVYEQIANYYKLPSVAMLIKSMDADQIWPGDASMQIYYLDNLREPNYRHLFQIRFKTSLHAHDFASIFISAENESESIHMLTLQFPARGDRHGSSQFLAAMKSAAGAGTISPTFEIEGYAEQRMLIYIRERKLSAFHWEPGLSRYLHMQDRVEEVKEVKKGLSRY